jgi:hypothetical protein
MKHFAIAACILSALSGCSQSYSPVVQAALVVHGTTDERAADDINAFLESNGYKTRTISRSPGDHKWYERNGAAFLEIEADANHCISFISFVKAGSSATGEAELISKRFLDHFEHRWQIERGHICG